MMFTLLTKCTLPSEHASPSDTLQERVLERHGNRNTAGSCLQIKSRRQRGSGAVQGGLALGCQAGSQERDCVRAGAAQHLQLLQHLLAQREGLDFGAVRLTAIRRTSEYKMLDCFA